MLTAGMTRERSTLPVEVHVTAHTRAFFKNSVWLRLLCLTHTLPGGWKVVVGAFLLLTASVTSQRNCNSLESAQVKCRHVPRGNLQWLILPGFFFFFKPTAAFRKKVSFIHITQQTALGLMKPVRSGWLSCNTSYQGKPACCQPSEGTPW